MTVSETDPMKGLEESSSEGYLMVPEIIRRISVKTAPMDGQQKRTTEELLSLDVRALKRGGLIAPGQERLDGVAPLVWTSCNFGGSRPWFVCPGCGRRAAILYEDHQQDRPLCRLCLDLAYPSQNEDRIGSAARRAEKSRAAEPGRKQTQGDVPLHLL